MNTLSGKAAIVTGGGTGIGRGLALALAQAGCGVAICGRRQEPLNRTAAEIEAAGGQALAVTADVASEQDAQRLVDATVARFGRLDILVNNAGVYLDDEPPDLPLSAWDGTLAINLKGPYMLMRLAIPKMRAAGGGHILNISSESGLNYYKHDTIYGLSKHALNDLGQYMQQEVQDDNIRVNTICPGMVVSEMTENSPGLDHSKCLYPEDIADLALFLLTRRANVKIGAPILIQTMLNPWE